MEERQRQADSQHGRVPSDERRPKGKDGKPKAGKPYNRDFGVPEPKAQDSFTDPESRIMKRAGGGFDYSFNAKTAVDGTAHIIVAAEVVNTSSDVLAAAHGAQCGESKHGRIAWPSAGRCGLQE